VRCQLCAETCTQLDVVQMLEALQEYEQPLMLYLQAWSEMDTPMASHHIKELVESCVRPSWLDSPFNPELDRWIGTGAPAALLAKAMVGADGDGTLGEALDVLNSYAEHQATNVDTI
jgi:hypothetical protein